MSDVEKLEQRMRLMKHLTELIDLVANCDEVITFDVEMKNETHVLVDNGISRQILTGIKNIKIEVELKE